MKPPAFSIGSPREWAIDLAIAAGIGVFLGVLGPFGSYLSGPMEKRIGFWVGALVIGFITFSLLVRWSIRFGRRFDIPDWLALAGAVALVSAPVSVIISAFAVWFWQDRWTLSAHWGMWYGETLVLAEPMAFGLYFWSNRHGPAETQPPATARKTEQPSDFRDRLPPRLGRDLLCLQMEDHYVRAHTPLGSDLILIALKDALEELDGVEGLQVHRSWWVAREAVSEAVNDGRNLSLRLINGVEAPVSRASVAKLRAAGWLD
jgi:LytTr DNA-binding domain